MAPRLTLDASFLIDLQREYRSGRAGPASRFMAAEGTNDLALSAVAFAEVAEGCRETTDPFLDLIRSTLSLLPVDELVALEYARIARPLRALGTLPGANDLWIAAVALRHGLPLVTRDITHFERIPGLELVRYR